MESEGRLENRLQVYADILGKRQEYLAAVKKTETELRPGLASQLYLYTIAPALMEFVGWVLEEAVRTGKKRLYFLSRDGYQMYLAARRLTELKGIPVECRYLYVSRYSMRVPSYHLELERSLDLICVGGIDVTPEKILRRAALTAGEALEIIQDIGWQDKYRNILNYRQIQELKQTLSSQPKLFEYIDRHSREKYENAMKYLDQEGLLSEGDYALVDSGWVGTLQQTLEKLVHSANPNIRVEGYYFGLYELPRNVDISTYHSWYFTPDRGLRRKVHFSNSLFEIICSAEEGMTVEYLQKESKFVPRTVQTGNPNRELLGRNVEAFKTFLGHYGTESTGQKEISSRRMVQQLFDAFMANPAELEVNAYGDNLFSDDVLETNLKPAATELTEEQIRDQRFLSKLWILTGRKQAELRESAWIEGSIVRCGGKRQKSNLRHARFYKYFVYARKQIRAGKK